MSFTFMNGGSQGGYGNNGRKIITTADFFEKEDNNGYVKLNKFKELLEVLKLNPYHYSNYSNFFDCLQEGYFTDKRPKKREHLENRQPYIFLSLSKGRVRLQTMVYLFDNLEKFIHDYANNFISIDFGWEDLIKYCESN